MFLTGVKRCRFYVIFDNKLRGFRFEFGVSLKHNMDMELVIWKATAGKEGKVADRGIFYL